VLLEGGDNFFRQSHCSFAAAREGLGVCAFRAMLLCKFCKPFKICVCIAGEAVDRHHNRKAKVAHVLNMTREVWQAAFEIALTLVAHALHGRDDHSGGGSNARAAHHDVNVFFRAQVGGKARLIHDVISKAQRHLLRNHAAGAVRNVAKRAAMHKGGRALGGLDKIGQQRVGEQRHHGAGSVERCGGDGFAALVLANHDAVEPLSQVVAILRQRHDSHDF